MMGTSPLAVPTTFKHTKFPSVEEQIQQLMKDQEEAIATHELAWRHMAEQHKNKSIDLAWHLEPQNQVPQKNGP